MASSANTGESQISPCGDTPNCVSSMDKRSDFFIEPFSFSGSAEDVKLKIKEILSTQETIDIPFLEIMVS